MNSYPDEETLEVIKKYDPIKDDIDTFLEVIHDAWNYADDGGFVKKGKKLELHTYGWSGNEDIIQALQDNHFFFSLYWDKSEKGGHYYFTIQKIKSHYKK